MIRTISAGRSALLALGGLALLASAARAGAWTQPRGAAYVRMAAAGLDTRSRFDAAGHRTGFDESDILSRPTVYRSREIRLYAEYGATDALTVYGSTAYKDLAAEQRAVIYETYGGSDVYSGVRYRLRGGAAPVSVSAELKLPTGYDVAEQPALGAGKADVTARLLAGRSFGRAYATGDVGFVYRAGAYRNEVTFAGEAGGRVRGPVYARAVAHGVRALGASEAPRRSGIFDPGLSNPRMFVVAGTLGAEVNAWAGVEASFARVLSGRESLAGNTVELAFVMKRGAR